MGKLLRSLSATALVGAGAVGAACALVAPRVRDEELQVRWDTIARYRYAHRGLHDNRTPAPENSLAAFRLAREWGYGSELDVHLTADGGLIVMHDSSLLRACGVEATLEDLTLAELRSLRLFGTQERIPTLGEVLEVYEAGEGSCPPLVVELKTHEGNYAQLTERVMQELDRHAVPYCVESFDPRVLIWLRRWRPDVIRGQLSEHFLLDAGSDLNPVSGAVHGTLVSNAAARPDFVAYRFEHRHHPALKLACEAMGAWLVYWTVKTPEDLAIADEDGAVSIFEGFEPS